MCYGNPHELLKAFLEVNGVERNGLGHTALEDFDHFCSYSGLTEAEAGPLAFAWAKLSFVSAWTPVTVARAASPAAVEESGRSPEDEACGPLTREAFLSQLRMFLRDRCAGTTAQLTPCCIAWWNGVQLVFAYLDGDDPPRIEEEFDLDDCAWGEWFERLAGWLIHPTFGYREDVRRRSSHNRLGKVSHSSAS